MLIQVNTDSSINGTEALTGQVEASTRGGLLYLGEQLTRVEAHLSDVASGAKGGVDDARCMLEARPAARQPVATSHNAATVAAAVDGATAKLKRMLERQFGRRAAH